MALKLFRNADGEIRRTWYARLTRNGRKVDISLDVGPVRGKIPTTPDGQWDRDATGDEDFELSRAKAEEAFRKLVSEEKTIRKSLRQMNQLDKERRAITGQESGRTPLSALFPKWCARWEGKPKPPTEMRVSIAKRTFSDFASFAYTFARKRGKACYAIEDVSEEMAQAYFQKLNKRYAWGTVRERFSLMRNAWRRFARTPGNANPFDCVNLRGSSSGDRGKISRVPLTLDQVKRLFDIVKKERPSLFPLVACAATTGLRLGDAVRLTWCDVELEKDAAARREGKFGTITLDTSKTGARVVLPIIEPFASVLENMDAKRDSRDVFLFPAELERYSRTTKSKTGKTSHPLRTGLIREIKPFIALAVMGDKKQGDNADEITVCGEPKTLDEIFKLIEAKGFAPKKAERLRTVAEQRLAGFAAKSIAKNIGKSPAQISTDLQTLEELTGDKLRARGHRSGASATSMHTLLKFTRKGGGKGRLAASILGWHSLRATFVVLAIEAGVPLAYVMNAVGHSTVKTTLMYFNPTGKHAAAAIGSKLGDALAKIMLHDGEAIDAQPVAAPALSLEAQIDALTPDEKKKLVARLLGL